MEQITGDRANMYNVSPTRVVATLSTPSANAQAGNNVGHISQDTSRKKPHCAENTPQPQVKKGRWEPNISTCEAPSDTENTKNLTPNNARNQALREQSLLAYALHYEGSNGIFRITQAKSSYEAELKLLQSESVPLNPRRIDFILRLIPLFDLALSYQHKSVSHLLNGPSKAELTPTASSVNATVTPDAALVERQPPKKTLQQNSVLLQEHLMKLNNHPNKIEKLIEDIESDYNKRSEIEAQVSEIQDIINNGNEEMLETLVDGFLFEGEPQITLHQKLTLALQSFNTAIESYNDLINEKIASAVLIQEPYKKPAEIPQEVHEQAEASNQEITRLKHNIQLSYYTARDNQLYITTCTTGSDGLNLSRASIAYECISKMKSAAESASQEIQNATPRENVIDLFFRAAQAYEQAAVSILDRPDQNKFERANFFIKAGDCFAAASRESQQQSPNQEVVAQNITDAQNFLLRAQRLPRQHNRA